LTLLYETLCHVQHELRKKTNATFVCLTIDTKQATFHNPRHDWLSPRDVECNYLIPHSTKIYRTH